MLYRRRKHQFETTATWTASASRTDVHCCDMRTVESTSAAAADAECDERAAVDEYNRSTSQSTANSNSNLNCRRTDHRRRTGSPARQDAVAAAAAADNFEIVGDEDDT